MTVEMITLAAQTSDAASMPLVTDIQYLEPFTSTSLNRKFCGIVRAGVFRGFACFPGDGLTLDISNTQNQTGESVSFGVALVERDDYLLTVRQQKPISLSIPAGQVSYVVLEAFFEHGVTTSQVDSDSDIEAASIKVLTEAQVQEHHVILCVADVPAGATELTNAHLNFDERELGGYDLESHLTDVHPHKQYVRNDADSFVEGDVTLGDNFEWSVGDARDLTLYHDGTNSFVENETGNLIVRQQAVNGLVDFQVDNGSGGLASIMKLQGGAEPSVKLFNGSNVRLTTTQAGVLVSGEIQTTGEIYENNQRVFSPNNRNISDSVTSTSSTVYASANAAKRAHDRAVLAESNSKTHADNLYNQLLGDAPQEALDTLTELAAQLNDDANAINAINNTLATKADKATVVSVSGAITGGGTLGANFSIGVRSATTSQTGVVQLSNSVASTSTAYAATPYAVKQAYDLANSKLDAGANAVSASKWYTARALTIGNATKSVDGSKGVSWSLSEIGAAPRSYGLGEYGRTLPSSILGDTALRRESGFWQGSNITGLPTYGHTWKYLWTQAHSNSSGYWGYIGVDFDCTAAFFGGQSGGVDKTAIRLFADNYHPNADKWTTARILSLSGDVTGSVSIDGSSNVTLSTVVADNSHNHTSLDGITKLRFGPGVSANDDAAIEWLGASNAGYLRFSTADDNGTEYMQFGDYDTTSQGGAFTQWLKMYRGQAQFTGNVSASTFTGALSGNASTASKWATGRTIKIGNTSKTVDGSANVTWSISEIGAAPVQGRVVNDYNSYRESGFYGVNYVGSNAPSKNGFGSLIVAQNKDTGLQIAGGHNNNMLAFRGWSNTGGTWQSWKNLFHENYHPNADKWTTARTLSLSGDASGSVSWDGSANATLAVTVANDSHTHDGRYYTESESNSRFALLKTRSDWNKYRDQVVGQLGWQNYGNGHTIFDASAGTSPTGVAKDKTNPDVPWEASYPTLMGYNGTSTYGVRVDSSRYADQLKTARTISLSGDASGSVSFDGSANATLSVTVADDSHNHIISNVDGLQSALDSKLPNNGTWTGGTGSSYTVLAGSFKATGNAKFTFYGDSGKMDVIADGEFYATEGANRVFHENYHPNADKWTTARTLSLSGDASGSVSIDGSANATLSVTVANDSHTHDGRYFTESEANSRFAYKDGSSGQSFSVRKLKGHGFGNDYNSGGVELMGNGSSIYPTIGFHQPGRYAGSLQLRNGGDFRFYAQGGSAYGVVRAATFYGALSGNASTATWADTVDVNSGNASGNWYDIVWHSGDTVYSSTGVEIQGSTNSIKSNRHYFAGTAYYLREATGNYGTVATYGRKSGWGGYSIEGRAVLMHDGSTKTGIYNDVDNEWLFLATHNAGAALYHNGSQKFETTSGGVSVTGSVSASGSVNDSSGRVYSPGNKPSKSDVGLSNVANYGVTTSVSSTSTSHYATASAVKAAYDRAVAADGNKVYTGTNADNLNFPVGSMVVAFAGESAPARNQTTTLHLYTNPTFRYMYAAAWHANHKGAALNGTWATRGAAPRVGNATTRLFQRIA